MWSFLSNYKVPILAFLVWRLALFALGFISINLLTFKASFPYIDETLIGSGFPQWIWHWGNFDGVHYLNLVMKGYSAGTHVFFPLYPILISLLSLLTRNNFVSAMLISNLSILAAAILFFNYLKKAYSEDTAIWSILFLFAFPTAFFFGGIYTESLFFLLILSAFFLTGPTAIVAGILAGLTRFVGLFVPFGIFGFLIYMLYSWNVFHDPLLFIKDQGAFQNARANSLTTLVTPPQVVWRYLKIFATGHLDRHDTWLAILEFCSFVLGSITLIFLLLKRRFKLYWLIFCFAAIIVPTLSGTFSSLPRYILVCFPLYIFLGQIKNKTIKLLLLSIFISLEALLSILFVRGYFVS